MGRIELLCMILLLIATLGCVGGEETQTSTEEETSAPAATAAPAVDAVSLFESKCSLCHSLSRPASTKKTYDEWLSTVQRMKNKGAPVSDEEAVIIAEYLAENYGK